MPDTHARFGADLRLLRDLDRQNSRERPSDLNVRRRATGRRTDIDLETIDADDNLKQALLLRFLTPAGDLAELGHPDYGSRLFELIGELNTETNRNRAKLFVLQALAAEPRIKQVQSVTVRQSSADRTRVEISLSAVAIDSDTPVNLVFPFFLQGGSQP
jgi:phage baseplate assembly protein W